MAADLDIEIIEDSEDLDDLSEPIADDCDEDSRPAMELEDRRLSHSQQKADSTSGTKYHSPIWNFFVKLQHCKKAKCLKCGLPYSHSDNTSNLIKVTLS